MLQGIVSLVVGTVASVLAGVLLLRFWMQVVRVRPPSSLGQFIFQLTDWLVRPLRRIFPGVGGYDWATMVGVLLVALLASFIDAALAGAFAPHLVLLLMLQRVAEWIFYGLMGLLLVGVVFSWINPHAPLAPFVFALTEPLLRPFRRIVPPVGGVDLSPLVAFIVLRIGLFLVSEIIRTLA